LRRLDSGTFSSIQKPRTVVVRDMETWQALWKEHRGGTLPLPKVDFAKEMVLGAWAGTRPTGGYVITIQEARLKNGTLTVSVRSESPPPDAMLIQALTQPFDLVAVKKTGAKTVWKGLPR
jgi:hypothetical protein